MEFVVWVEGRLAGKRLELQEVAKIEREASGIRPEELGLTLAEGKIVLKQVQERIVQTQIEVVSAAARMCAHCGRNQWTKDLRSRQLRTVFGAVDVFCRRYIWCNCRGGKPRTEWPLRWIELKRTTPELSYLLAKWGSTMPYRRAAQLLSEFLPLSDGSLSPATVRRHTLDVGRRIDMRATEPDEYDWPESRRVVIPPSAHLSVAIDGTYIRANSSHPLRQQRQHHVVAGRIERDGQLGGRFAWVAPDPYTPKDFMKAALDDHGWTEESNVTVLADGADGLKAVVRSVLPQAPHNILDWFHISMRLRPIEQMAPGIADLIEARSQVIAALVRSKVPLVRHQMWNGKWASAINRMRAIYLEAGEFIDSPRHEDDDRLARFRRHILELRNYLKNNWNSLINYAHARRSGQGISSAPAESGMSHLVNQRMGKRQPMSWSSEGAHLLLQVRCAVLDQRLETLFREWHLRFRKLPAVTDFSALR